MQSVIRAAGFMIYFVAEGRPHYLLLRNSKTCLWEPPKGECERGESLLACAIRECQEETGLGIDTNVNEILSPTLLSYFFPSVGQKTVYLFPCQVSMTARHSVRLSSEHSAYQWLEFDRLRLLPLPPQTLACYEALTDDARYRAQQALRASTWRSSCVYALQAAMASTRCFSANTWYLAGSVAASEHTVLSSRVVSDIDLVVFGDPPSSSHIASVHIERLRESLTKDCGLAHAPWISICRLRGNDSLANQQPFWTYFRNHGHYLIGPHTESSAIPLAMDCSAEPLGISRYDIFRLMWYFSLPDVGLPARVDAYHTLKAVITASILDAIGLGATFDDYHSHRLWILQQLLGSRRDSERLLLEALQCLDIKLHSRRPNAGAVSPTLFWDWTRHLLIHSPPGETGLELMIAGLFAFAQSQFDDLRALRPHVGRHLGSSVLDSFDAAILDRDCTLIWLVFTLLRLSLWPSETQNSTARYSHLLRSLTRSALKRRRIGESGRWLHRVSSALHDCGMPNECTARARWLHTLCRPTTENVP